MRLFNLSLLSVAYAGVANRDAKAISDDDACSFIGARIFKVFGAVCRGEVCGVDSTDGQLSPLAVNVTVPCERARAQATAILEELPEAGKRKRVETGDDVEQFLKSLSVGVVPVLKAWIYSGSDVLPTYTQGKMKEADIVLRRLRSDWSAWTSDRLEHLVSNETVREVFELSRLLIRDQLLSGKDVESLLTELGPVANYLVDLYSILGKVDELVVQHNWMNEMISYIARSGNPMYRSRYNGEATEKPLPLLVIDSRTITSVSRGIMNLAGKGGGDAEKQSIIEALKFVLRLKSSHIDEADTVGTLLNDLLLSNLCPRLHEVADKVTPSRRVGPMARLRPSVALLRLIKLCRESHEDLTLTTSVLLGQFFEDAAQPAAALPTTEEERQAFFLSPESQRWPLINAWKDNEVVLDEIESLVHLFFNAFNPFEECMDGHLMFLTRDDLGPRFESVMRGLGRALAIAFRLKLDIRDIELPHYLEDRLMRLDAINTEDYLSENLGIFSDPFDTVYEPMFFVQQGAMEILGPASFSSVSPNALGRKFNDLD